MTDATTGLPIAGICVDLYDSDGDLDRYGCTDESGLYEVDDLNPGTHFALTGNYIGYIDELWAEIPCPGLNGCDPTTGTPIAVGDGTTTGIDFTLEPGGRIGGLVTEEGSGAAIATAAISIYDAAGILYTYGFADDLGAFVSDIGLVTGTYYALAVDPYLEHLGELWDDIPCHHGDCEIVSGTPIDVVAPETVDGIDFALVVAGRITGRITDERTGQPIESPSFVGAYLYDVAGRGFYGVSTDNDGVFKFLDLAEGFYYLHTDNSAGYLDELYNNLPCASGHCDVTSGTPISVRDGAPTTGIDFALAPGGRIAGAVLDGPSGAPIEASIVDIYDAAGEWFTAGSPDDLGDYVSFTGLPSGAYYVLAESYEGHIAELWNDLQCPAGACGPTTGTPVQVTVGRTTRGIDFELEPGGRIQGRMTDDTTGLPIFSCVYFYEENRLVVSSSCSDRETGVYLSYGGLPDGNYWGVSTNFSGFIDEIWNDVPCAGDTCELAIGDPIPVQVGHTTSGVSFGLEPGARIAGTVLGAPPQAHEWADACVQVWGADGGDYLAFDCASFIDGTYATTSGLPTGTYFVTTSSYGWYLDELWDDLPCIDGDCDPTSGTPVFAVAPETTVGVDFELARDNRIFEDGFESGDTSAWSTVVP